MGSVLSSAVLQYGSNCSIVYAIAELRKSYSFTQAVLQMIKLVQLSLLVAMTRFAYL